MFSKFTYDPKTTIAFNGDLEIKLATLPWFPLVCLMCWAMFTFGARALVPAWAAAPNPGEGGGVLRGKKDRDDHWKS